MKKNLLIAASMIACTLGSISYATSIAVQAATAKAEETSTSKLADRAIKHLTRASDYKSKWFDHKKDMHIAKYDLLKKQHIEKMDLKKQLIAQLGKNKDVNAYLSGSVDQMKALHKKHHAEWKALSEKWHEKAKAQAVAQDAELNKAD
ncbi:hypothetical protein BH09DEP1_BH09DEP1_8570 [soil metagenome]